MIELDIDMKETDELYAFTNYKLYQEYKTWTEAEAHCKKEGGHLASMHSKDQQALAEKAAQGGQQVWIGARKEKNAEWSWSDNST